jgi:hypothetical protein
MGFSRDEADSVDRMQGRRARLFGLAFLMLLPALFTIGCGSNRGYPTAKPVQALGHAGECAYCHKKIDRVEKQSLVTFDAVEYIVCDEKCAESLRVAPDR